MYLDLLSSNNEVMKTRLVFKVTLLENKEFSYITVSYVKKMKMIK